MNNDWSPVLILGGAILAIFIAGLLCGEGAQDRFWEDKILNHPEYIESDSCFESLCKWGLATKKSGEFNLKSYRKWAKGGKIQRVAEAVSVDPVGFKWDRLIDLGYKLNYENRN